MFQHNVKWWGIEHVELHDPKQAPGESYDAITYAMLKSTGYFDKLAQQQYEEQFKTVFKEYILDFVLSKLDENGITPLYTLSPLKISKAFSDIVVHVGYGDEVIQVVINYDSLGDFHFAEHIRRELYHRLYRDSEDARIASIINSLTDAQKQFILDVVKAPNELPYNAPGRIAAFRQLVEDGIIDYQHPPLTGLMPDGWEIFRRLDTD